MWEDNLQRAIKIWTDGGVAMIPLLGVALLLYGLAMHLLLTFKRLRFMKVPESTWTQWIEKPELGRGEVGEIIRYTQDDVQSLEEVSSRFTEIFTAQIPPIDRRLLLMSVLVAAAPLLGLLGTVLGMLVTFRAISLGGGKMAEMVAQGISEALISTEMGLLIAIPGLFLVYVIRHKRSEYEAFLARLESLTLQHLKKKLTSTA